MEVSYSLPKYRTRLFSFLFDLMCMVILALLGVFAMQAIMNNTPYYKNANQTLNRLQLESGLYVERKDGTTKLMCEYYKVEKQEQYNEYNKMFDDALTAFYKNPQFFDQEDPKSGIYLYNTLKIPEGQSESKLFIYEDESKTVIVEKPDAAKNLLNDFYTQVMSEKAVAYVVNNLEYVEATKTITLTFIFVILLVPVVLSVFIFELIIPLCLRRGRKTLGKLIFKIAVVDNRGLSAPLLRFLARFSLFFVVEVILGIVTFAIPLIVSFTMMVFSKKNQSFHDYVAGTYVVEAPMSSICMNEEEYMKKHERDEKFVLNKEDVDL